VVALLAINVVVNALTGGADAYWLTVFDGAEAPGTADTVVVIAYGLQFLSFAATAVAFVVWFSRAYKNVRALGGRNARYRAGWAIGAWFVPILNLFRPKQLANDIWRASDPDVPPGGDSRGARLPPLLNWWWGAWIVASLLNNRSGLSSLRAQTAEEERVATVLSLASDVLSIIAAILAILVVRSLTQLQDARAQRLTAPPGVPVTSGLSPAPEPTAET
jgi:hypothetical protein